MKKLIPLRKFSIFAKNNTKMKKILNIKITTIFFQCENRERKQNGKKKIVNSFAFNNTVVKECCYCSQQVWQKRELQWKRK